MSRGPREVPSIGSALVRLSIVLALVYAGLAAGLGWWQLVQAQALTVDPANPLSQAAERSAPRGTIYDSQGVVLAQTTGRPRRARPRVPAPRGRSDRWLQEPDLWNRRPREHLEHRADRARPIGRRGRAAAQVPRRPVRPQRPAPLDRPSPATGGAPAAWQQPRCRGRDRAVVRTHPRVGDVTNVRPEPARRHGDGARVSRPAARRPGLSAARSRDAGPLRARLGLQDGHCDRGPRFGLDHARYDLSAAADTICAGLRRGWVHDPYLAPNRSVGSPVDLRRSNGGVRQHLLRARCLGHGPGQPPTLGARLRVREPDPVRPAHRGQPGDQRRRAVQRLCG